MLVKIVKILYPNLEGQNFDFSYYLVDKTQALHMTSVTKPLRKRLTRNLVMRYKRENPLNSVLNLKEKKTVEEILRTEVWVRDVEGVLNYEV